MAVKPPMRVLSEQNGVLCVKEDENHELDYLSHTVDEKVNLYALSKIWVNGQPAECLKKFKSQSIQKENVDSYQIVGNDLYLSLNQQEQVSLTVCFLSQEKEFKVSPKLSMEGLKRILQKELKRSDFDIEHEKGYSFNGLDTVGKALKADEKLVIKFHKDLLALIEEENKQTGTLEFKMQATDFVNFEEPVYLKISKEAPPWRIIDKGLNLIGECQNAKCKAHNKKVCVQKGFVNKLSMSKEASTACCPLCETRIKNVTNCIFLNCIYSIEGQTENGRDFRQKEKQTAQDKPESFSESTPENPFGNRIKWNYLEITAIEIPPAYIKCTIL